MAKRCSTFSTTSTLRGFAIFTPTGGRGAAGRPAFDRGAAMAELPPANVKRWTIRRKAAVVTAVANGALSPEEACRRYQLTDEELQSWRRAYESYGLPGLRSTRLQHYRNPADTRDIKKA